jgi:Flp pilus assembly protein TadB
MASASPCWLRRGRTFWSNQQADEGTAAHIFQLWLVIEVVAVAAFAVEWLPRRPRAALFVLIVQMLCALAACAPVFYFRL